MSTGVRSLAVIVPTLDESERLPALLRDLRGVDAETIVVDGGSSDDTRRLAEDSGARVLVAPRGRASQLRRGAAATDAEWLLFLHADSRLPPASVAALSDFLGSARRTEYAHFEFELDGEKRFHRFIEFGQRIRQRVLRMPYGDQGLVVSRGLYEQVGGYPAWAILEDVGILDRLARRGRRSVLPAPLVTSARRYDSEGGWAAWLRNLGMMALFRLGVSPDRLVRWYAPHRSAGSSPHATGLARRTVAVFAKAPRVGRVKTRLAAEVGDDEAVRIYRVLGRDTVDALRSGPYRVVVYYDPPESATVPEMIAWLGREGVEYRPQAGGDLGARMAQAFRECFAESDEVCVVGTDIPEIGTDTLAEAFGALANHDAAVGPATDGGYYLLALRQPRPDLFDQIPWSTSAVGALTRDRLAATGSTVHLLEPKTDVDVRADVPAALLRGAEA